MYELFLHNLALFLVDYRQVSIGGVGTFTVVQSPAIIEHGPNIIKPPQLRLDFTRNEIEDSDFVYLCERNGYSKAEAQSLLTSFIEPYNDALLSGKAFNLGDFGVFVGQIFLPAENYILNTNKDLPNYKLKPSPKISESIKHADTFIDSMGYIHHKVKPSPLKGLLWPLFLAIICSIAVILWFFKDKQQVVDSPSKLEMQYDSVYDSVDEVDEVQFTDDVDEFIEKHLESEGQNIESTQNEVLSEKMRDVSEPSIKSASNNHHENNCVIIVGVFKNELYTKKMKSKVEKSGYKVFVQEYNGMNRVGLYYDCKKTKDESFTSKIRQQFDQNAWYLHDTL